MSRTFQLYSGTSASSPAIETSHPCPPSFTSTTPRSPFPLVFFGRFPADATHLQLPSLCSIERPTTTLWWWHTTTNARERKREREREERERDDSGDAAHGGGTLRLATAVLFWSIVDTLVSHGTSFGFWIHMSVLMWFKFWFGFSFESYLNSGSVNAVDGSGSVQDASRVRL
uniref:Uncharacterized protein n=1 Tax=Helianthus annuus TaxID=4232 RepID=A0A251RT74_HELAN